MENISVAWILVECPKCDGSGWNYCSTCENTCEHDRVCSRCHGEEYVAEKVEGLGLLAAHCANLRIYLLKRIAEQNILARRKGHTR